MRAYVLKHYGGPEGSLLMDVPAPMPRPRDILVVVCAAGLNPVDCLKILQGRVISTHLKDLNEKSAAAHDVPYGTGVSNIPAILDELKRQGFAGNVSIEYEYLWENNVPEVAQCIGFVRGYTSR